MRTTNHVINKLKELAYNVEPNAVIIGDITAGEIFQMIDDCETNYKILHEALEDSIKFMESVGPESYTLDNARTALENTENDK